MEELTIETSNEYSGKGKIKLTDLEDGNISLESFETQPTRNVVIQLLSHEQARQLGEWLLNNSKEEEG